MNGMGSSSSMVVSVMRELSIFSAMESKDVALLASVLRMSRMPRGTVLYEEGRACRGFLVLADGEVVLTKAMGRGKREILTLGANCILGHVPLLDGGNNVATARVTQDALVLACDRDHFERLDASGSAVALKLMVPMVTAACRLARGLDAVAHGLYDDPRATLLTLHTS